MFFISTRIMPDGFEIEPIMMTMIKNKNTTCTSISEVHNVSRNAASKVLALIIIMS